MRTASKAAGAEGLFGRARLAVLGLVLFDPGRPFYLREIARRTGLAVGSTQRELAALVRCGILKREGHERQVFYRVDASCPLVDPLRALVERMLGPSHGLRTALAMIGDKIECAFVAGELKGDASAVTDIVVIGSAPFEEVLSALAPTQQRTKRELRLMVFTPAGYATRTASKEAMLSRLLSRPREFLRGSQTELDRLGKETK